MLGRYFAKRKERHFRLSASSSELEAPKAEALSKFVNSKFGNEFNPEEEMTQKLITTGEFEDTHNENS